MAADRITQQAIELVAENRIRQAMEEGQFDNLPGLHQPIPDLDLPYDPDWWIKQWVRREVLPRDRGGWGGATQGVIVALSEKPPRASRRFGCS